MSIRVVTLALGDPHCQHLKFSNVELLVLQGLELTQTILEKVEEFDPQYILINLEVWQEVSTHHRNGCSLHRDHNRNGPIRITKATRLTPRQLSRRHTEVLVFLAAGLRNAEIAEQLGVSTRTVKGYFQQLFAIFDVSNRTELLSIAMNLTETDFKLMPARRGRNLQS